MKPGSGITEQARWEKAAAKLPQARLLQPVHVSRWAEHLSYLPEADAERAVARSRGFTADEIALMLRASPDGSIATTPRWIVKQKLVELMPLPRAPADLQAEVLQPLARSVLLRTKGMTEDTAAAAQFAKGRPQSAWMIETPALFVMRGGATWIVDFRNVEDTPVADAQPTEHDRLRAAYFVATAADRGVQVAGVLSVPFVVAGQAAVADWMDDQVMLKAFAEKVVAARRDGSRRLEFAVHGLEVDASWQEAVKATGDRYWNAFVMAGQVPADVQTDRRIITPEAEARTSELGEEYIALRHVQTQAKEMADAKAEELSDLLTAGAAVPAGLSPRRVVSIVESDVSQVLLARGFRPDEFMAPVWDVPALVAHIQSRGEDPKAYCRFEKVDSKKAEALLSKEDRERLMRPRMAVWMGKAQDMLGRPVESIASAKQEAVKLVQGFIETRAAGRVDRIMERLETLVGSRRPVSDERLRPLVQQLRQLKGEKETAGYGQRIAEVRKGLTPERLDLLDRMLQRNADAAVPVARPKAFARSRDSSAPGMS